jgi:chitin disaccharide deacetylase
VTRLIVNADDFGLTSGVNRAIIELHAAGVLTSTSLMANEAATKEAAEMARRHPMLGVGCHVVLVDGTPTLDPGKLPTLVDERAGRFHPTAGAFLTRLLTMRIRTREVEAETAAQIARLQSYGMRLTHIDTHKHMHMFPGVLRPVLRAARKAGIFAVRNPFETLWSLNATPDAPELRRAQVVLLRRLEPAFQRIVEEEGFSTTDGAVGVLATGSLNIASLKTILSAMPEGTFELVSHPGYRDADLERASTRLLASREIERNALMALREILGVEFISFAQLSPAFEAVSRS